MCTLALNTLLLLCQTLLRSVSCRSPDEQVHFEDILKANSEDLLYLDTFAVRNLVLTAPRSMRVLSAMQVRDTVHRVRGELLRPVCHHPHGHLDGSCGFAVRYSSSQP